MTDKFGLFCFFGFFKSKYIAIEFVKGREGCDQKSAIVGNMLVQRRRTYVLSRVQGRLSECT